MTLCIVVAVSSKTGDDDSSVRVVEFFESNLDVECAEIYAKPKRVRYICINIKES